MSWTDFGARRLFSYIESRYNVTQFVETGTYKGVGARSMSMIFSRVLTCELNPDYYKVAAERLLPYSNIRQYFGSSPEFLKLIRKVEKTNKENMFFFYLDAHFYDPSLPPDKRFVVKDELASLEDMSNCIIVIHDYDCNGLGHITYDGQPLNWDVVGEALQKVNPDFTYYHNTQQSCEIITEQDLVELGLTDEEDLVEAVHHIHEEPRLTYRGFLYALPFPLSEDVVKSFGLTEFIPPTASHNA